MGRISLTPIEKKNSEEIVKDSEIVEKSAPIKEKIVEKSAPKKQRGRKSKNEWCVAMGVKKREIHQGDIYMVNLSVDSIDHEQAGIRPCCIVSCDNRNEKSSNVFIFPITHAIKKKQPCHYRLYKKQYDFFSYDVNTVLCEEGRSISKKR